MKKDKDKKKQQPKIEVSAEDNQKNILQKIIGDAKAEANSVIEVARTHIAKALAEAKQKIAAEEQAAMEKAKSTLAKEAEQDEQIARNETKKVLLAEKQQIISEVFASVRSGLEKMGAADTKKLTDALSKKYSKAGDTVTKAGGGIIISNAKYEIKLTLDELLKELRQDIEADVVKMLFAD